ncbi:MAG: bifunctional phosphopantothenoylcysteine decarboxylase/phosphopantothenate--cysteine ligase CoaBC [Gammaproteobacteria bacterium]|nr:bifunctional phosphopantothenoylcysteine decarboxylase/phosphopantothenate--cysteine ligase CoaBC [Gammaproteobacteria bacterium]
MNTLYNKHILLGITGSIAAYKSAELTRRLKELGADIRVVMTTSATRFITPLTLQALSGHPVNTDLLDTDAEAAMGHIELARWADLILVAPASADFLARLTAGRANDLLSAICLASYSPIAVAPAMNQGMWENKATQDNINTLQQRDIHFMGPGHGSQACGETGAGRMIEPEQIIARTLPLFTSGALSGKKIIITAGPTREAIDPVRYISNHSSGKMGFAIAEAAANAGADVTLVCGPTQLTAYPDSIQRIDVITASQMYQSVMDNLSDCDIFIASAAVADYRPGLQAVNKIKKQHDEMQLRLVKTPDILASVASQTDAPYTVGFAAETENVLEYARKKRQKKGIDMIVANKVGPTSGFNQDNNELDVIWQEGHIHLNLNSKKTLARDLIQIITEKINAIDTTQNTGLKTR